MSGSGSTPPLPGNVLGRTQSFGRDILPRGFMIATEAEESREWGIWYSGNGYTVSHFLKSLGPGSEILRFPTRQAAMQIVEDRWSSSRYQPRMIPNPKSLPEQH